MKKLGYIRRLQIDKMTREQFVRLTMAEQKLYWATPLPQARVKEIFETMRQRVGTNVSPNADVPPSR